MKDFIRELETVQGDITEIMPCQDEFDFTAIYQYVAELAYQNGAGHLVDPVCLDDAPDIVDAHHVKRWVGEVLVWAKSQPSDVPDTMTPVQAANYLQVSRDTIDALCKSGDLQHQRIKSLVRIKRADLDRLDTSDIDW